MIGSSPPSTLHRAVCPILWSPPARRHVLLSALPLTLSRATPPQFAPSLSAGGGTVPMAARASTSSLAILSRSTAPSTWIRAPPTHFPSAPITPPHSSATPHTPPTSLNHPHCPN